MTDDEHKDIERAMTREEYLALFESNFSALYPTNLDDIRKEDIGGLDDILEQIDAFRIAIDYKELYGMMGSRGPKGFMLYGPPGTGKTMIAKYIATELGARFVDLPLSMFESKWVGEAEKMLKSHLENFKEYYRQTGVPLVVFFDEAEETLRDRGSMGWHGPRVNLLLREMDGLGNTEGIIFGAATNHLDKIDPAALRPGRFDFLIKMPDYSSDSLGKVFKAQRDMRNRKSLGDYKPFRIDDADCERFGREAYVKGLTPADVAEVYRRSVEEKVRKIAHRKVDGKILDYDMYHVYACDLDVVLGAYVGRGVEKRRIGF